MLSNKAASEAPIDAETAEGANDDARSVVSGGAESMRSMVTNESVRSVVSGCTGSERSMVSDDMLEAVQTFGKIRTPADKVAMKDAINLQKVQYDKAGVAMGLTDANNATECNHDCWVFEENFIIDIRGGSTVWLRPVSSVWENGSPWWALEQVANPKAPREMWNALQMVWGMEAFKMENDGSLVHPEEVLKRAKKELAKQKVDTSAPAGESMSGREWTKTHKALFEKLNNLAEKGLEDSSGAFMRQVGFDRLDPGETALLIRTLGSFTESQFKSVLPTLELLLERFLQSYNPGCNGLAVKPFQAVVVMYCGWTRMVSIRNGHVPVCTMATFTAEAEEDQLMPTPLGAESNAATKQTLELKDGELMVQGPQGSTKVLRPAITTVTGIYVAISNIKILLVAVHPTVFAMQTLMSVEFMLARAISRDADDGIYEATCILTQCCLWLGSEVSRHLRLSTVSGSGLSGFSFALTADQKRTVSEQKSRHEVLGLRRELKSMTSQIDQRPGRIASSMSSGTPGQAADAWKSKRQKKKERQQQLSGSTTWQSTYVDPDAQAPAPAAAAKGNKGKGKPNVTFQVTGTDAKGKPGKGKGSKGSKGGKGYISKEANAALTKVHGKGADFFDTRKEWCEQWSDYEERRTHCFKKESLQIECDNGRCPACNPQQ
jgi:hypothetical protein